MALNGSNQDPWGKPKQGSQPDEKPQDNSSQSNWGENKKQQQSPPDIEDVFNNLLKKDRKSVV